MLKWNYRMVAAMEFLFVGLFIGLVASGCSEAPEIASVEPDATAEVRVEEATKPSEPVVSAETKARIDTFTADVVTSIRRCADFLAAQENISVQADVAYEVLQPNGQMLEFGGTRDFLIRRPDRLRFEAVNRDGNVTQFFFDGNSISIDKPNEDAYVRIERPGTYYAAMDYLVDDLGAPSALDDFFSENLAEGVETKIVSGFFVQRVMLDDHVCEQLAWRTKDVDVQLWVREGEEAVPCRVVITYVNFEGHPQFSADFHDWDFAPDVDDELFTFIPPESAEQLQAQAYVKDLRDHVEGK